MSNIKNVYKLITSFLLVLARHAQSTQNSNCAVSFQYLKKEMRGEVDFLFTDKHQSFLQVDTFIFCGCGQACQKYPKKQVCSMLEITF